MAKAGYRSMRQDIDILRSKSPCLLQCPPHNDLEFQQVEVFWGRGGLVATIYTLIIPFLDYQDQSEHLMANSTLDKRRFIFSFENRSNLKIPKGIYSQIKLYILDKTSIYSLYEAMQTIKILQLRHSIIVREY